MTIKESSYSASDFNRESFSKYFVYESYDEESGLFFNRGSVGFMLMANPMPGLELTAQNEIAEFIKNEEDLPNGSSLQILMIGSSDVEFMLSRWEHERLAGMFKKLANQRCNFLRAKSAVDGVVKDIFLLISLTLPSLNTCQLAMQRRRETLKSTFESINLHTIDVDDRLLIKSLQRIWGNKYLNEGLPVRSLLADYPGAEESGISSLNDFRKVSEKILPGNFSLYEEETIVHFNEDDCFITLCAEDRPREWSLQLMDLFIGNEMRRSESIKTNFLIHVGIQILENQALAKANAFAKREAITKNKQSWF